MTQVLYGYSDHMFEHTSSPSTRSIYLFELVYEDQKQVIIADKLSNLINRCYIKVLKFREHVYTSIVSTYIRLMR